MPERDDSYPRNDLPSTTGEFRATPDASASTAQFKAFAAGGGRSGQPAPATEAWPEQPWAGEAPQGASSRKAMIIVAAIVAVAVVVTLVLVLG